MWVFFYLAVVFAEGLSALMQCLCDLTSNSPSILLFQKVEWLSNMLSIGNIGTNG